MLNVIFRLNEMEIPLNVILLAHELISRLRNDKIQAIVLFRYVTRNCITPALYYGLKDSKDIIEFCQANPILLNGLRDENANRQNLG